jgi:MATE family multidrug resistance protein
VLRLTIPVMISLIAEPLTGLVDTAFIARLGAVPLAALGVGTMMLSSVFWIFNFLGIGAQTEVAQGLGESQKEHARDIAGLALALAFGIGVALICVAWPNLGAATRFMSDDAPVQDAALVYLKIRLLAAPAVLLMLASFGALRGLQDMRTPLRIAVGTNIVNLVLDPLLIFGLGPVPAFGIAGAAWATTVAHWMGAAAAVAAVRRRPGLPSRIRWSDARALLVVGRDLFFRTGLLLLFLLLATRAATRAGIDAGAANQAIRQVWVFTALLLDAYAAAAQSLVGYFLGAARIELARRVAAVATLWSVVTGVALALTMWLGTGVVLLLLVPESAQPVFGAAWLLAAAVQPMNAVSFVTDGILWGARDYRFLRNVMFAATVLGVSMLMWIDLTAPDALTRIWIASAACIAVRSVFGVLRVWPGIGDSAFRKPLASVDAPATGR